MNLPTKLPELPTWAWAALGFGAVYILLKPKDAAASVGKGAANIATGLVKGISEGLFGIPDTDSAKCEAALSAGETYEASKYCPASRFVTGSVQSMAEWLKGLEFKPTRPGSREEYAKLPAGDPNAPLRSVTESNILNGYSFEDLSAKPLYQFDVESWIDQSNSQNRTLNPVNKATPVAGLRG